MKYVGIRNSKEKSALLKRAHKLGKITPVALPSIAGGDCSRHLELLRLFDSKTEDFSSSEYYQYQKSNGKSHQQIIEKISRFRKLYASIQRNGYDYKQGYIVVTTNGARLDGSHRSSIVEHLGYKELDVIMIDWEDMFSKKDLVDIYSHIAQQQKRYNS